LRKVLQTFIHDYTGPWATVESGGETIDATGGHPFWVVGGEALNDRPRPQRIPATEFGGRLDGRWVLAENLQVGDELFLRSGTTQIVDAISVTASHLTVYNIHVEELENYAVGHCGILVHNTNDVPPDALAKLKAVEHLPPSDPRYIAAKSEFNEAIAKRFGPLETPPASKMFGANGTQTPSKTLWKGEGKARIDVENPNPGQRPGQIHYQDNAGGKYLYDPATDSFPGAPRSVNDLLNDASFRNGINKALKFLGE
jgi:hypothetical protein